MSQALAITPPQEPRKLGWKLLFGLTLQATLLALLAPADWLLRAKVWVASWLPWARQLEQAGLGGHADKWLHFGLFALLGGLATHIWWRWASLRPVMLGLLALGVATECLQHFIPGRGASAADFAADALGLLAGGVLLWQVQRRARRGGELLR